MSLNHDVSMRTACSGNSQDTGGGSSGYNTGRLTSSTPRTGTVAGTSQEIKDTRELQARELQARELQARELQARELQREKLKEELLRQYEAGRLGSAGLVTPQQESARLTSVPRQIPTIEENRANIKRMSTVTVTRPPTTAYMPDMSRPPPGYCRLQPSVASLQLYQQQAHPLQLPQYSYEDNHNLVTRLLQTLVSSVPLQPPPPLKPVMAELPGPVTPGPLDKVLNWDTKPELAPVSLRSRSPRSFSREGCSHSPLRSRRSPSYECAAYRRHRPRRSVSRSHSRRRRSGSGRSRHRHRHHHSDQRELDHGSRDHDGRHHDHREDRKEVKRAERRKERREDRGEDGRESRREDRREDGRTEEQKGRKRRDRRDDWSPRTEYFSSPEMDRGYKRPLSRDSTRQQHVSPKRKRGHERGRKIELSPRRSNQSIRDIINNERDFRPTAGLKDPKQSPVKKRVKDRLGPKPGAITEIFNMEESRGKVGGVAVVKEYVDSKMGLLELRTSEGGRGSIVLFSVEQVWVADRQGNPNGLPVLLTQCEQDVESLPRLLPLGLEVLVNARKVRSDFLDLQATVVWPKFTELPKYKLKPSKLDADHAKFHTLCRFKKMTPICINGLAATGSLNIWSAKVQEILDEDWGLLQVSSYPRDAKREFSYKFVCFFHKEDVWVDDGVCVRDHEFYREKPLSAVVELLQPVNLVARSIIKEKGQFMKKSTGTTIEMQALCVSLLPWTIPKGAPLGTRVEGGPGAFGGCNRGETPYIFKPNYHKHLNFKLAMFLKAYGKEIVVDPEIIAKMPNMKVEENVKIKKKQKVTENNPVHPTELLSNVESIIREAPKDGFGLAEVLRSGWVCLFSVEDCVAAEGASPGGQFKAGTKVHINANLLDRDEAIQYVASCVWRKTESCLALPNITDKSKVSRVKREKFESLNRAMREHTVLPSQIELKEGEIIKILDDNFGVINQEGKLVLFDTCDFWTDPSVTAARAGLKLAAVVSAGEKVLLHAALVTPDARVPYLATAVWKKEDSTFFSEAKGSLPPAIPRSKVHQDKIKIYQTVSSSTTVLDSQQLKEVSKSSANTDGSSREELVNVRGKVKFGIRLHQSLSTSAGVVVIARPGCKDVLGFFMSSESVELSEHCSVCVPGSEVWCHGRPLAGEFAPVTHVLTVLSGVHSSLPEPRSVSKVVRRSTNILSQIKQTFDLNEFISRKPDIICYNVTNLSTMVSYCKPSGRLVCMTSEHAGILEDHNRQLAYFETTDTNLPSALTMKDVALVMSRCRDVSIRFQASSVLDGPVKMIVHDGTVAVGANLSKFYPEVKLKRPKVSLKPNSFGEDKLLRATKAVGLYREGKVLVCEDIVESSEYPSLLLSSKSYHVIKDDSEVHNKKIAKGETDVKSDSEEKVKSISKGIGLLSCILNEHFGLIEFCVDARRSYCLFDTFDLYLSKGRTASMLKLSVDRVLSKGQEICFNAYEMVPGSSVPWLANGVWRPNLKSPPKPVSFSDISKEKISVFEKVSETCASVLSLASGEDGAENLVEDQEDCRKEVEEVTSNADIQKELPLDEVEKSGSLPEVLDQKVEVLRVTKSVGDFAILTLRLPSKDEVKCLFKLGRISQDGRPVDQEQDWGAVQCPTSIVIKARRILGNKNFEYQGCSAIVSGGSEIEVSALQAVSEEELDKNLEEYNAK